MLMSCTINQFDDLNLATGCVILLEAQIGTGWSRRDGLYKRNCEINRRFHSCLFQTPETRAFKAKSGMSPVAAADF